jgi:hypothetical protein
VNTSLRLPITLYLRSMKKTQGFGEMRGTRLKATKVLTLDPPVEQPPSPPRSDLFFAVGVLLTCATALMFVWYRPATDAALSFVTALID